MTKRLPSEEKARRARERLDRKRPPERWWIEAQQIVERYLAGEATSEIAETYGCVPNTIGRVLNAQRVTMRRRPIIDNEERAARRRAHSRDSYERNREQILASLRGVTVEQYDALLAQQGGGCAICGEPERALNPRREVRPLAVDHDHSTGKIRGLLCAECNIGLGKFRDDPALLHAALSYLERGTSYD